MFTLEDLGFYFQKKNRASLLAEIVWEYLENLIIYSIGLSKDFYVNLHVDSAEVTLLSTSRDYCFDIVNSEIKRSIDHNLFILTDTDVAVDLRVVVNTEYNFKQSWFSFCYDKHDIEDDGEVVISGTLFCDLKSLHTFKEYFLPNLSKEIQYAINKNIFCKMIDENIQCKIDAYYEYFSILSKINNKHFNLNVLHSKLKKRQKQKLIQLNKKLIELNK